MNEREGGPLAVASAARINEDEVELLLVPVATVAPIRYTLGNVAASSLRLLLDDALGGAP